MISDTGIRFDTNEVDIHSENSIKFYSEILKADPWTVSVLKKGLIIPFSSTPPVYHERNNKSALDNMDKLKQIIGEWELEGKCVQVKDKPRCVNPLTMVIQSNPVRGEIKYRPVIDMSRHFNKYMIVPHTKLQDLNTSELWVTQNIFQTSLDLTSMFHHVKLHESMYEFFGFELPFEGETRFYVFTILQFGNAYAVYCVTKLLNPVCSFMHSLSILFSIYIDDIRIMNENYEVCNIYTEFCVKVLTFAGWKVNIKKSTLIPTQQLLYLGMYTDSINLMYFSPVKKLIVIKELIYKVLDEKWILKRELAVILGKIASRLKSHGNICQLMTRHCQHILGKSVHNVENNVQDWEGFVYLDDHAKIELKYFFDNIIELNGKRIINTKTPVKVVYPHEKVYTVEMERNVQSKNELFMCSDASDSHAFIFDMKKYNVKKSNAFEIVKEFEFNETEKNLSSSFRELLSVVKFTEIYIPEKNNEESIIYWLTDSKNLFSFLKKGSRKLYIQTEILKIKRYECINNVYIVPVWEARTDKNLTLADIGSKFINSTDEWSVDNLTYKMISNYFKLTPSIDCFATDLNKKCKRFFSKIPQEGSLAVNFFTQELYPNEIYWACPPPRLLIELFKHIVHFSNITVIIFVPVWKCANYWPYIVKRGFFSSCDRKV